MNEFIRGATSARLAARSVAPCTRSSTSPPPKGGQRLPLVAKAAACAGVRARLGLDDAGVDYVLIGGLAVGAHGFPRATKDLDIVPAPDAANLDRLATLLRRVGAQHHGLGDFDASEFRFDPLDPAELAISRGAVDTALGGHKVRVCSRDDLIAMKRAAGRPQDLLDLDELGA